MTEKNSASIDADEDGYRTVTNSIISSADLDCEDPEGQVSDPATDCNDALDTINPTKPKSSTMALIKIVTVATSAMPIQTAMDLETPTPPSPWSVPIWTATIQVKETATSPPLTATTLSQPLTQVPEITLQMVSTKTVIRMRAAMLMRTVTASEMRTSLTLLSSDLDCDDDGEGAASEPATDCNDSDLNRKPSQTEEEDNVDEDCDGIIDNNISSYDDDGDGYSEDAGDCDDSDLNIYSYADEVYADGIDSNCDDFEANNIECEGAIFSNGNINSYVLFCDNTPNWSGNNKLAWAEEAMTASQAFILRQNRLSSKTRPICRTESKR